MQDKLYNTTIALAGIVQALSLVRELAHTGKLHDEAFQASIYSIFQTSPSSATSVFGGLGGIKLGLEKLIVLLGPSPTRLQTRYLLSIIHLQKKISRSQKIMESLTQRITQTQKQVEYFHLMHPTVIANLADIYLQTISTLKFRIIIWGNERILSTAENMEKIRALLLAGVRSAVLWRQMGGSRFQLIFSRGKIRAMAEKILAELSTDATYQQ